MSLIVLSDTERNRFGDWLLQEARTAGGLAEQMDKLGKVREIDNEVAKRLRMEAVMYMVVERQIRGGEKVTIQN